MPISLARWRRFVGVFNKASRCRIAERKIKPLRLVVRRFHLDLGRWHHEQWKLLKLRSLGMGEEADTKIHAPCVTTSNLVGLRLNIKNSQDWGALGLRSFGWERSWPYKSCPLTIVLPRHIWQLTATFSGGGNLAFGAFQAEFLSAVFRPAIITGRIGRNAANCRY